MFSNILCTDKLDKLFTGTATEFMYYAFSPITANIYDVTSNKFHQQKEQTLTISEQVSFHLYLVSLLRKSRKRNARLILFPTFQCARPRPLCCLPHFQNGAEKWRHTAFAAHAPSYCLLFDRSVDSSGQAAAQVTSKTKVFYLAGNGVARSWL